MFRIIDKNSVIGYWAALRPIAVAVLTLFAPLNAAPVVRFGVEANLANQNYSEITSSEMNSGAFLEFSRSVDCPMRLSGGVRAVSITSDDLGYLLVGPEVNAFYYLPLARRISLSGGLGAGYLISNADEIESGAYCRVAVGAKINPLPVIDLRLSLSAIPFKSPNETAFSNYGFGLGISYMFGFKDRDRDWVSNDLDICPNTPRGAKVDEMGCAFDNDGDGVFDGLDKCPNTASGCIVDEDGCPVDSDDDGVCDGVDKCSETPGHIEVDSTGCPKDSDGDGVPDYMDKCPGTPRKAIVDEFGCPKDSDEDGVPDGLDQCPQTPSGFIVNSVGCPFVSPVEYEEIRDAYDISLSLKAAAMQKLENIAERLRAYPFRIVEIGVYTDSEGSVTYNINRGMRVAEKVRDVLVARGVTADQLKLKGYGEADPVAPNSTSEGLLQNRRIVFKYINDK